MRAEDLATLEFAGVLDAVARHAASEPGREACRALTPETGERSIRDELSRVAAFLEITEDERAPLGDFPDIRPHLDASETVGARLSGTDLREIGLTIATARQMRGFLRSRAAGHPLLLSYLGSLHAFPDLDRELERAIDEEGGLRDDASPALRAIRRELRQLRSDIESRLARVFRQSGASRFIAEEYVTVRNGRYVVPVKSSHQSELPGIVQDRSASGETLFVEPLSAVDWNNRLLIAAREEGQEEARVLAELTRLVGDQAVPLLEAFETLVTLDTIAARAGFALKHDAICPEMGADEILLPASRHPLLVLTGRPVTPVDVTLDAGTRLLVITGPNTGGKSVALKTLGLATLMAQSGIPLLCGEGARLPVFDGVWTDIGDQQTVAGDLSTFSGHVKNLGEIVRDASPDALILLDEPGTGTDPEDGAALAKTLLGDLADRGARVLATTHFQSVKVHALALEHAQVAGVDFDPDTFQPRYRLVYGSVGPSLGLDMARRLGFPDELLRDAEDDRGSAAADLARAISSLEDERRRYEELSEELGEQKMHVRALELEQRTLTQELQEKKRRKWSEELGEAKTFADTLREEGRRLMREARKRPAAAHRLVDAGNQQRAAIRSKQEEIRGGTITAKRAEALAPIRVGDQVEVLESGVRGEVLKIAGDRAQISRGAIRFDVPLNQLRRKAGGDAAKKPKRTHVTQAAPAPAQTAVVSAELNLIGERVRNALPRLESWLDQATLESHAAVRIIHGHGTGALRDAVREHLDHSPYVAHYEGAAPESGGDGATVAYLR